MSQIARNLGHGKARPAPIALADALQMLRANRSALEAIGIVHAGVFGSVARGEAGPQSDLDIVVELDRAKVRSVFDLAGVWRTVTDLFGVSVDVVERDAVKPAMRDHVLADAVDAF